MTRQATSDRSMIAALKSESDMLKVYDLALIVHDYMSGDRLERDQQLALSHLTCELVVIGDRLKQHFCAIHAAVGGEA